MDTAKALLLTLLLFALPIAAFIGARKMSSRGWWLNGYQELSGVILVLLLLLVTGAFVTFDPASMLGIYSIAWWVTVSALFGILLTQNWKIRRIWYFDIPGQAKEGEELWQELLGDIGVIRSGYAFPTTRTVFFDSESDIPSALSGRRASLAIPTRLGVLPEELAILLLIPEDVAKRVAAYARLSSEQQSKFLQCLCTPNVLDT